MTAHAFQLETRDDLIAALARAAELEHIACCQYLFAAFSLKEPAEIARQRSLSPKLRAERAVAATEWKRTLLLIARQEMMHLGEACNLLSALGAGPRFLRPELPEKESLPPIPAPFELQPFGKLAIRRLKLFERGHKRAAGSAPSSAPTMGDYYRAIGRALSRLGKHRGGSAASIFVGPPKAQVANEAFGMPARAIWYDVQLMPVVDLKTALRAIDRVVTQGEGPEDGGERSHFELLEEMESAVRSATGRGNQWSPAREVAPNPIFRPRPAMTGLSLITHPASARAASCFSIAYETLLLMLTRFYSRELPDAEEMNLLRGVAFFPLMTSVIRPLGELLTQMPLSPRGTARAGATFELEPGFHELPYQRSFWSFVNERFDRMIKEARAARSISFSGRSPAWLKRFDYLIDNLAFLARRVREFKPGS